MTYSPLTRSLLLDGVGGGGEYVTYPNIAAMQPERTDPFSAGIWFKTTTASNDALFCCLAVSTGWQFDIPAGTDNIRFIGPRAAVQSLYTTSATAGGAPNIRDDNWHHAIAVSDGNSPLTGADMHLFIDGVEMTGAAVVKTGSVTNTTIWPGAVVTIGNQEGQSLEFPGNLCHASAWGFALTAANVKKLYGYGAPQNLYGMSFADPVFWGTLGNGDGIGANNMLDLSVNANHGTTEAAVDAGDFVLDVPVAATVVGSAVAATTTAAEGGCAASVTKHCGSCTATAEVS